MQTYVALLRGVNVSGRVLRMEDLRQVLRTLGLSDVDTYIQSGNAVFRSDCVDRKDLRLRIEEGVAGFLDAPVTVLLRTAEEFAATVAGNPFLGTGRATSALHVTFLLEAPEPARLMALAPERYLPDECRVQGRDVYLYCPGGYGRTKLSHAWFERQLRVPATTRNWATVERLSRMASRV